MLIHELITATQADRDREVRTIMHRRFHLANTCLPRSRGLLARVLSAVRRGSGVPATAAPSPTSARTGGRPA
jgi:hypothetical protein